MNVDCEKGKPVASAGSAGGNALRAMLFYSVLLFAAAWCLWGLCTPLMGDDLITAFRSHDLGRGPLAVPRYAWGVWNHCNARTGDMMAPLWLYMLPRVVSALLLGIAVCTAIWGVMRLGLAGRRAPLTVSLALLSVYVVLPWWDMDFYVCHFNYVWGTALSSLSLLPLLERRLRPLWLWAAPLVVVAVATHEALGLPLGCGLVAWLWLGRRPGGLSAVDRWWVAAMLVGAVLCLTSPASYRRLGHGSAGDLAMTEMLVQTVPLSVALVARAAWLALRGRLVALVRTRWTLFAVASVVSAGLALVSGVEGRAGWYAQIFALVALIFDFSGREAAGRLPECLRRLPLLAGLLCCACALWQGFRLVEVCEARRLVLSLYRESPGSEPYRAAVGELEEPWIDTCMPLSVGSPVKSPDLFYEPQPLPPGEKNPADPVIGL